MTSYHYDSDGDEDLFVGSRLIPQKYGLPATSYILENNGEGIFTDLSQLIAPELKNLGMVTDAEWIDYDNDNDIDLIVVGQWMPITIFENNDNRFTKNLKLGLDNSNGWWNTFSEVIYIDNDGFDDLLVGNQEKIPDLNQA